MLDRATLNLGDDCLSWTSIIKTIKLLCKCNAQLTFYGTFAMFSHSISFDTKFIKNNPNWTQTPIVLSKRFYIINRPNFQMWMVRIKNRNQEKY